METVTDSGLVDQVFLRCVEDCFEPIMITDIAGKMTYVNPAWTLTYGFQKHEAIGQTPRCLRSTGQNPDFYKDMWKTILNPEIGFWRGEVINQAKDGHLVPVLLTITPYRAAAGDIRGYMGIAVDLSDHKRMEEQIFRQDRLASIGMLAGGLAHEVGNPLGAIRGRAEMVINQIKGNEEAQKNLELIIGQIDRISGLIQSLLRVSRVPVQILLREVELVPVVEEVFVLMQEACNRAGIELRTKDLDCRIHADPSHLQQLFLNLFINSQHAIEEQKKKSNDGSFQHFIEVSAKQRSADRIVVSVKDSGCGVSAENLRKVFQPFYTTKAAGQGTGLGLAIVSKIVEEMNGHISVESEGPGCGSTFRIEFKTK